MVLIFDIIGRIMDSAEVTVVPHDYLSNWSNSCQDISCKSTDVYLMVALEDKSGGHKGRWSSPFADHEHWP